MCLSLEPTHELQTLRHLLAICSPSFAFLLILLLWAEKHFLYCKHEGTGDQAHVSCKRRGDGSSMSVSNDDDVD